MHTTAILTKTRGLTPFSLIGSAMNLLMIIIILFAIMVSACISFIAWELSSGKSPGRKTNESGEVKESKDLPDS